MTDHKKEIDEATNVETTGHEWDGIKELNNPAPRWWLWVLYITIIWSIGYYFFYPAWPTLSGEGHRGGTEGSLKENQYTWLIEAQEEIKARRAVYAERFAGASFDEIVKDDELYAYAQAGGAAAFKDNCATCHGTGGAGGPGYPNLNDDDWIWGGSLDAIHETILYGIRSDHDDTRSSMMPPYGEMLETEEQHAVAEFVHGLHSGESIALSEDEVDNLSEEAYEAKPLGARIFAENCATCHGYNGEGMRDFGAPNLADAIWLKSQGSVDAILNQIRQPQHGVMPAWSTRLDEDTIRMLSVYVHGLGGGETDE